MSAPVILAVSPSSGDTDVVLGTNITITFDQAIDPKTVTESTFSLMGPGQTGVISPTELLKGDPASSTGREYITGDLTFPMVNQVVFNPDKPLRPNVKYTLLLVGAGAAIIKDSIKNLAGEPMAKSGQVFFTTGTLTGSTPPVQSPLPFDDPRVAPWMKPVLQPDDIIVHPRALVGNDLTQVVELIFPETIDMTSFDIDSIEVAIEPLVDDPLVTVPGGLIATRTIDDNKVLISITGWA
jgi:hypothetical protein